MSRNVRLLRTYKCSRLRRPATLELERLDDAHYPNPANQPEHFEWREVMVSMVDWRDKN
jgi:hypothetical protein